MARESRLLFLLTLTTLMLVDAGMPTLSAQNQDDAVPDDYPRLTFRHGGPSGRVNALVFASSPTRLYIAGEDKVVDVFFVEGKPGTRPQTTHATTLRWERSRDALGQIHALAISPINNLLAISGFSARNGGGDLALFDTVSGSHAGVLPSRISHPDDTGRSGSVNGHQCEVAALAMSPSGNRLISADVYAETRVWDLSQYGSRPIDSSVLLRERHEGHYQGSIFPVMMTSDAYAFTVEPTNWKTPRTWDAKWTISYSNLNHAEGKQPHRQKLLTASGQVRSLVRNSSGSFFAACFDPHNPSLSFSTDEQPSKEPEASAYIWKAGQRSKELPVDDLTIVRLTFGTDDQLIVSGMRRSDKVPLLRFYRCRNFPTRNDFQLVHEIQESADLGSAEVLSLSSDGRFLARYSSRQQAVMVYQIPASNDPVNSDELTEPAPIRSSGTRFLTAVFSDDNNHRLALMTAFRQPNPAQAECYFDVRTMRPRLDSRMRRSKWQHRTGFVDGWTLDRKDGRLLVVNRTGQSWLLGSSAGGELPTAGCRFSPAGSDVEFVAIAPKERNGIYLYRLTAGGGQAVLVRYFRDHTGVISSLNASRDGLLLVSAALDRTVKFWSLKGLTNVTKSFADTAGQRLGARFDDRGEAGLEISELQSCGILAARGIRNGTQLMRVEYKPGSADPTGQVATSTNQMLAAIVNSPPESALVFNIVEPAGNVRSIWFRPGWEPLATLYHTRLGDWVCVSPSGYYAGSDGNGDDLLVWQQSLGRAQPVKLARGREMSARFRNPDVLRGLIRHQDLAKALSSAGKPASEELLTSGAALTAAFATDPQIRLTEPVIGVIAEDDQEVGISAVVRVPAGQDIADYSVDAFLNGQFIGRQVLNENNRQGGQALTVHWKSPPVAPVNRVRVILKKHRDDPRGVYKFDEAVFVSTIQPNVPRIHSLVIGANAYRGVLPALNYARQDAEAVDEIIRQLPGPEHAGLNLLLTDDLATTESISAAIQKLRQAIQSETGPQQLVVFLAGHGKRLELDGQYYFLPPDVTSTDEVQTKGIPWSQFESLSTLPCRKLFIIDTCDSGSILEATENDPSQAARAAQELSDSQIVVIAATAETGTARELVGFEHGALTQCLIEGIREGKADGAAESESRDRIVTLRELAEYVQKRLPALTEEVHKQAQIPTVAPGDLLNIQSIPLKTIPQ